jgi:hypothetical protein
MIWALWTGRGIFARCLAWLSICLFATAISTAQAQVNVAKLVKKHPVWLVNGLKWEHVEGETDLTETYAGGTILYFGTDGKFGMFGGVIIRQGRKMGLSEGEGGTVYSGKWAEVDGGVEVTYRLVEAYKLILPQGEKPPEVPGPIQTEVIRLAPPNLKSSEKAPEIKFAGKIFEPKLSLRAADLRFKLETIDKRGPDASQKDSAP